MYRRKSEDIAAWEHEARKRIAMRSIARERAKAVHHQFPNKGLKEIAEEIFAELVASRRFA